jgi:hypothetical protein
MLLFVCTPNTKKCCSSESDDYKEAAVLSCASVIWNREQIKSDKTVCQTEPPRAGSGTGEKFFSGTPARALSYRHGSRNELLGYERIGWGRGRVRKQSVSVVCKVAAGRKCRQHDKAPPNYFITIITGKDESLCNIVRPQAPGNLYQLPSPPPPSPSALLSNNIPPQANSRDYFNKLTLKMGGSWLRYCATSRKVAGSIPDGVIGIFH